MEVVVSSKLPSSQPYEHIISCAKEPDEGEIGYGYNSRPVRHIPPKLSRYCWPVKTALKDTIADAAEENIECDESENGKTLDTSWNGAPADIGGAVVPECGRYDNVAFQ